MSEIVLPVDWVQQQTSYFCGPAAAQMTLAGLQVPSPVAVQDWQQFLWLQIQAQVVASRPSSAGLGSTSNPSYPNQLCEQCPGASNWHCWPTSPKALERVLNNDQDVATFTLNVLPTDGEATLALLDTIDDNVPGVALVYGWGHWLVVHGYVHDEPDACLLGARAVNAVYIRNSNAAASITQIDCEHWLDTYQGFVPCGGYADAVVVIGGTLAMAGPPPQPADDRRLNGKNKRRKLRKWVAPAAAIVPPNLAQEASDKAAARLLTSPRWEAALASATVGPPLLVQRLDRDDSFYYIVPYLRHGVTTARIMIDALTLKFREASGIERPGGALPPFVDPAAHGLSWHGETVVLPSHRTRVIRPGTVGEHPVLVWKPCRESTTPFMPFYQRTVGNEIVYLRVDGKLFTRLTTGPA